MRQLWQNTAMKRRADKTPQLSQQLSQYPLMFSAPVTHTTDALLPGSVADLAIPTTTWYTAHSLLSIAVSLAAPSTGKVCAIPRHHPNLPLEECSSITHTPTNTVLPRADSA